MDNKRKAKTQNCGVTTGEARVTRLGIRSGDATNIAALHLPLEHHQSMVRVSCNDRTPVKLGEETKEIVRHQDDHKTNRDQQWCRVMYNRTGSAGAAVEGCTS